MPHGCLWIADDDGNDLTRRLSDVTSQRYQFVPQLIRPRQQFRSAMWLAFDALQCGQAGGCDRCGRRGRENVRSGSVREPIDQCLCSGDETAD